MYRIVSWDPLAQFSFSDITWLLVLLEWKPPGQNSSMTSNPARRDDGRACANT